MFVFQLLVLGFLIKYSPIRPPTGIVKTAIVEIFQNLIVASSDILVTKTKTKTTSFFITKISLVASF